MAFYSSTDTTPIFCTIMPSLTIVMVVLGKILKVGLCRPPSQEGVCEHWLFLCER